MSEYNVWSWIGIAVCLGSITLLLWMQWWYLIVKGWLKKDKN